jgi:hypothetical protein
MKDGKQAGELPKNQTGRLQSMVPYIYPIICPMFLPMQLSIVQMAESYHRMMM